ncbi:MAG: UDP-4-amino-4,6-dideoxy-N-acetyl-beta-L-altrosamine N-acetyltransferase [Sulfurimonas sp.]|nr:UDP-4-amino-4,6-dideoxy-N-acetyl-beta-L-altrosamine N-acetyltransferase [Sulfurimonas sp.]
MVLSWRNDKNIRKWMLTQDIITQENHLNYIESLSSKKNKIYFLVKRNSNPIGVIDLTNINYDDKNAEIGLYTNPALKGIGSFLMQEIINYGFNVLNMKTLISKVFSENYRAIKLYKKFDFKEMSIEKDMIIMELKNENR